jgi:hypothetical protein
MDNVENNKTLLAAFDKQYSKAGKCRSKLN